jgi:hypothetical protein
MVKNPSKSRQIKEFGKLIDSEWAKVVCVRSGNIRVVPLSLAINLKPCDRFDFVQAIENVSSADMGVLDFLKVRFPDYEPHKRDAGSIFIR